MGSNKHLRDLEHGWFNADEEPLAAELVELLQAEVVPNLKLKGRKLADKRETAIACLANLIFTGAQGKVVADYRSTAKAGVRLRKAVWDALIEAGYAKLCVGSEQAKMASRYSWTPRLARLVKGLTISQLLDMHLGRNSLGGAPSTHALVVLRASDTRKPLPLDAVTGVIRSLIEDYEDIIEFINRENLNHTWLAENDLGKVFQPNVCVRQMHTDHAGHYARLYSWSPLNAQNMPKRWRATMRIDGDPVGELDYSAYHIRMLYHIHKLDPDGDLYRPELVLPRFHKSKECTDQSAASVREWVKTVTNILLNVDSKAAARAAATKALKDHKDYELLATAVYGVERSKPGVIVDRIVEVHADVAHCFFDSRGKYLQSLDGCIMLDILKAFAEQGKPALGIHDSIVCKRSDLAFCSEVMRREYVRRFKFEPLVKHAL